jgi:pyruvate/2-oxoglutarate/acetoin dehydrogenase E1 component
VRKTNRVLIVHEDTRTGGIAGEITARINETASSGSMRRCCA